MTLIFFSRHQIDTTMPLISYSLANLVEYPSCLLYIIFPVAVLTIDHLRRIQPCQISLQGILSTCYFHGSPIDGTVNWQHVKNCRPICPTIILLYPTSPRSVISNPRPPILLLHRHIYITYNLHNGCYGNQHVRALLYHYSIYYWHSKLTKTASKNTWTLWIQRLTMPVTPRSLQ